MSKLLQVYTMTHDSVLENQYKPMETKLYQSLDTNDQQNFKSNLKSLTDTNKLLSTYKSANHIIKQAKQINHQHPTFDQDEFKDNKHNYIDDLTYHLSNYYNKHHTPAFLTYTPKKDRYNYASYISTKSYLNYLHNSSRHMPDYFVDKIHNQAQKLYQKLDSKEQKDLTRMQAQKPKLFKSLSFKAKKYIAVPFNKKYQQYQNNLKYNIKTSLPLISKAKHPLTMAKLVNTYKNPNIIHVDRKGNKPKLLNHRQDRRPEEYKLYKHLNQSEQKAFVNNIKQWRTPQALDVAHEASSNVLTPTSNNATGYDTIATVHYLDMHKRLNKNIMPIPLKNWLMLTYQKQSAHANRIKQLDYNPSVTNTIKEEVIKADHIHSDHKNVMASKRAQAKQGDLSAMLSGIGEEVKAKTKGKRAWSQNNQPKSKDNTPHVKSALNQNHKRPTKQQILAQRQQQSKTFK